MQYNRLGKSDLSVSEISFGCMSLDTGHADNTRLLHHAADNGINLFDTADVYGKGANEETVGKAFKDIRQRVIIATKVGNQWRADGSGWNWNPRKDYILRAAEDSLRRLQTDYIDLYQLHGGTINDPIDETLSAFETLKEQGKIREYGISSIRPNVIREYVSRSGIVSVMMQYSLLDRRPEESCLELLRQHQIGVLVRGSLAKGLLAGKEPDDYLNYSAGEVERAASAVSALTRPGRSAAAAAVRFVLHQPALTAAVLGIRTPLQLVEALAITQTPPLTEPEMESLRNVNTINLYEEHR